MKVYVLLECWDYEGEEVRGVFSSRELAEAEAARRDDSEDYRGPVFRVKEWDVVGPSGA